MNGWGAPEPAWWRNLHAQPETTLAQAGGTTISVVGRSTVGEKRDRCANAGHNSTNGSTASMLAAQPTTRVTVRAPRSPALAAERLSTAPAVGHHRS